MAGALLPSVDLDQLSLSLGLDVGSLRGAIVGHLAAFPESMTQDDRGRPSASVQPRYCIR